MSWLAILSVALTWSVQYADSHDLLLVPAIVWCAMALLAWHFLGGRAALLVLLAGRTLCGAGWLFETRLPEALARHDLLVEGVVCDFPRADAEATRLMLDLSGDGGSARLPARLHLSWYAPAPPIQPGQRWQLLVRLKPPRALANAAGFDLERWFYQQGIGATGYVRNSVLNRQLERRPLDCPTGLLRGRLAERMKHALDGRPGAAYVLGMTVAERTGLGQADWELMRRTGISHLLAISGFHIAMVVAPVLLLVPWLLRLWPALALRPGIGPGLALVVATFYSALAGFGVSVLRALLMLGVVTILVWQRRHLAGFQVLALAALLITWLDPPAVLAASFWLSFAGVAWLLLAARATRAATRRAAGTLAGRGGMAILALLRLQLLLGIGLAPLTLNYFGELSWLSPLGNLVAVPAFAFVLMPLALGGAALVGILPGPGGWLLRLAAAAVERLMQLLASLASMLGGFWQPPDLSLPALVLCVPAALALAWWRPFPLRSLALVLILPLLAGSQGRGGPGHGDFHVTVLDVGQGLAVLVRTAGHVLVYDAGPAYRQRNAGEDVVVPVLRAAGIRHLDMLMISHDDLDHAGGAPAILQSYPDALLVGSDLSRQQHRHQQPCRMGDAWEWDQVRFRVLGPVPGLGLSGNDESCVLRIEGAGGSVLLPGDIERRGELVLDFRGPLEPVDLVLAPHHGSRSSSSPSFVEALRPRYVVFSTGYMNRWGFPSGLVSERWAASGACLLETAAEGALHFAGSEDGLRLLRTWRRDHRHLWTGRPPSPALCPPPGGP